MARMTSEALTLAAAQAAGPCPPGQEGPWLERVRLLARGLYTLSYRVAGDVDRLNEAQRFPGSLVSVDIEQSSQRGVLTIANTNGEQEQLRTDRTDTPDGAAMVALARSLVGHRVLVWKVVEKFERDPRRSARIAVHLDDLGVDPGSFPEK